MGIRTDISQLSTLSLVEVFVWDTTNIGGTEILRWHNGTNGLGQSIFWQGQQYFHFPVEVEGFEQQSTGKLPRPTLRASNIGGSLGAFVRSLKDALKSSVVRKRTLARYLDAINFIDGNPYADPTAGFPDEQFFVARKVNEDPIQIEMELAVPFDVENILLPRRQVIAGTCQWKYRGAECSYAGGPVQDINGNPTSDPTKDQCRKTLSACRARFGEYGILKTSAFPSSLLNSYT